MDRVDQNHVMLTLGSPLHMQYFWSDYQNHHQPSSLRCLKALRIDPKQVPLAQLGVFDPSKKLTPNNGVILICEGFKFSSILGTKHPSSKLG